MIWLWFVIVQLIQLLATILGWLILVPFCLSQAWTVNARSIKDNREIDSWTWSPLNYVYGNPEDGVSGQQAVVWTNGVAGPYNPSWTPALRAFSWSAIRNSCDNLKYIFANKKGPLKTVALFGLTLKLGSYRVTIPQLSIKLGWQMENGFNVPILSFTF